MSKIILLEHSMMSVYRLTVGKETTKQPSRRRRRRRTWRKPKWKFSSKWHYQWQKLLLSIKKLNQYLKQAPVPNLSQQPELDSIADYQNVQNLKPQFPDI